MIVFIIIVAVIVVFGIDYMVEGKSQDCSSQNSKSISKSPKSFNSARSSKLNNKRGSDTDQDDILMQEILLSDSYNSHNHHHHTSDDSIHHSHNTVSDESYHSNHTSSDYSQTSHHSDYSNISHDSCSHDFGDNGGGDY